MYYFLFSCSKPEFFSTVLDDFGIGVHAPTALHWLQM